MHAADPALDAVESDVISASREYCAASIGHLDFRAIELIALERTVESGSERSSGCGATTSARSMFNS